MGATKKQSKSKDLTGKIFGLLTVVRFEEIGQNGVVRYMCSCKCGNYKIVSHDALVYCKTKSCGCENIRALKASMTIHGLSRHPLYGCHRDMRERCYNPRNSHFKNYGARGIFVSENWKDFLTFFNWAISNGWKKGLTLERKDNNGPYAEWNCCFATRKVQISNRRNTVMITYKGKLMTLTKILELTGHNRFTIYSRIRCGKTGDDLFAPTIHNGKRRRNNG